MPGSIKLSQLPSEQSASLSANDNLVIVRAGAAGDDLTTIQNFLNAFIGGWIAYTPTVVLNGGGSNGNAVITGGYSEVGKTVNFWCQYVIRSTTSFTGMTSMTFTLPLTADSGFETSNQNTLIGGGSGIHGTTFFSLFPFLIDTTHIEPVGVVAGAAGQFTTVSATTPLTWGNGDTIKLFGTFQAA